MLNAATDDRTGRLAHEAERYLGLLFAEVTTLEAWADARLPYLITDKYALLKGEVMGCPCVFMAARSAGQDAPAAIARHWTTVNREAGSAVVIVLAEALNPRDRQALIRSKVPFMVPGNQLFAPALGVDLRERFRALKDHDGDTLSPTAQVVVLAALLGRAVNGANASALARRFCVSPMSMTRAFDELEAAGLAELRGHGRQRLLALALADRELWEKARPRLRSPVRKRRQIARMPQHHSALWAGETALAEYTMLSPPPRETWAISAKEWRALSEALQLVGSVFAPLTMVLETWSYDPRVLTDTGTVDPLSLYLSLDDRRDDRVSAAADELLEAMPWS
jgi:DNA-binding MarR family transcriptional regulator